MQFFWWWCVCRAEVHQWCHGWVRQCHRPPETETRIVFQGRTEQVRAEIASFYEISSNLCYIVQQTLHHATLPELQTKAKWRFAKFSQWRSTSRRFQTGKGPSRDFLHHDCEIFANLHLTFVSSSNGHVYFDFSVFQNFCAEKKLDLRLVTDFSSWIQVCFYLISHQKLEIIWVCSLQRGHGRHGHRAHSWRFE